MGDDTRGTLRRRRKLWAVHAADGWRARHVGRAHILLHDREVLAAGGRERVRGGRGGGHALLRAAQIGVDDDDDDADDEKIVLKF